MGFLYISGHRQHFKLVTRATRYKIKVIGNQTSSLLQTADASTPPPNSSSKGYLPQVPASLRLSWWLKEGCGHAGMVQESCL